MSRTQAGKAVQDSFDLTNSFEAKDGTSTEEDSHQVIPRGLM
jgi:hypothetical protein